MAVGEDHELAGEDAEGRHAQYRQRAQHARPQPISRVDLDQAADVFHQFCVPVFCVAWPTVKKIADLVSECMVMCRRPAKFAYRVRPCRRQT
jgi:hypothetical protein